MTEKTPDDRTTDTAGNEQPVSTGPVEKDVAADMSAAAGLAADPLGDSADAKTLAPPASSFAATPSPGAESAATVVELDPLVPTVVAPPADYSAAGVPSLDFVRDKIEGRYAKSLGSTELAQETPEARSFEEQAAQRAEAAKEKLEAIRRSLRGDTKA